MHNPLLLKKKSPYSPFLEIKIARMSMFLYLLIFSRNTHDILLKMPIIQLCIIHFIVSVPENASSYNHNFVGK